VIRPGGHQETAVYRPLLSGLFCLVFVTPALADTASARGATVTYLRRLQATDGGFLPESGAAKTSLRATTSALRALKYFGGEAPDRAACADFVKKCFDKASGGFADAPGGKPDAATTAVGVMAAVELKLPTEPYEAAVFKYLGEHAKTFDEVRLAAAAVESLGKRPPQADGWLAQVKKLQNADGTYGKGAGAARATGGAVAAVLRLDGTIGDKDAVLKALSAGQRKDGGFGKEEGEASDLETTYRVLRTYHMLKARPDADRVLDFVARCRNADGGYGVAPGKPSSVSGTYYAGIIRHWLGAH
jgi:prenyltransferase beta subunit